MQNAFTPGQQVLFRLAAGDRAWHWIRGTIVARYPENWHRVRYDVESEGRVIPRVSELSLRAIAARAA